MTDPRGPTWRITASGHRCGWPGCEEFIAGRLWGCRDHWLLVPVKLRDAYMEAGSGQQKIGVSIQEKPSVMAVDQDIQHWVRHQHSSAHLLGITSYPPDDAA